MTTWRITSFEEPNVSPVFGPLTGEQRGRILSELAQADARLASVAETLAGQGELEWRYEGVLLTIADSGQTSIDVAVEEVAGKLSFSSQLRPRNFFPTEIGMWQPGRPPLRMATDAWDVDGTVSIRFRTRVSGRPYTIQQHVVELAERRFDDPVAAAEAFGGLCSELAELALSREATVAAWRPEEPEADGPCGDHGGGLPLDTPTRGGGRGVRGAARRPACAEVGPRAVRPVPGRRPVSKNPRRGSRLERWHPPAGRTGRDPAAALALGRAERRDRRPSSGRTSRASAARG